MREPRVGWACAWRPLAPARFDAALTSLGVNDVTSGATRRAWRRRQEQLQKLLRERFGVRHVIVSGLPPVHRFPALRRYGETRTRTDEVI